MAKDRKSEEHIQLMVGNARDTGVVMYPHMSGAADQDMHRVGGQIILV